MLYGHIYFVGLLKMGWRGHQGNSWTWAVGPLPRTITWGPANFGPVCLGSPPQAGPGPPLWAKGFGVGTFPFGPINKSAQMGRIPIEYFPVVGRSWIYNCIRRNSTHPI